MGVHESFRFWLLYSLKEESKSRDDLIKTLEKRFRQTYIPVLSEFEFTASEGFDFKKRFDELVQSLLDQDMVTNRGDTFL